MSISEEPVSADNGDAADRVAAEDADWGDGQWVASSTALQGFISEPIGESMTLLCCFGLDSTLL